VAVKRYARIVAVVIPLLVCLADAAGTISIVGEGRRCAADCTSGVVLLPFAPTLSPLGLAGIGEEDAEQSVATVVLAYAVVLALTAAWWSFVGGLLARRYRSLAPYVLGLFTFAVVTLVVKVPIIALEARMGLWASIPIEAGIWAVFMAMCWRYGRTARDSNPLVDRSPDPSS
jgi:hypothetical protein